MTLLGVEKHLNSLQKSLVDKLTLPTIEQFEPDVLLAAIIRNYQSLPCLYEDPDFMYEETDFWWKMHKNDYARMINALIAEYNPIENYNKTETRTGNSIKTGNNQITKNGTITVDGETTCSGTVQLVDNTSTTGSNEIKVSAFNESDYQPSNKVTETGTSDTTNTTTSSTKDEVNNNTTTNDTIQANDSSTINDSYNLNIHGNIGVTTNQQMINDEIKLRLRSYYGIIAKQFSDEMLLSIW